MTRRLTRPDERSDARERALYLLYEADSKGISPSDALALQMIEPDELTTNLVLGVERNRDRLDAAIARRAVGWSLDRMPVIDLSVLRIATYELLFEADVPRAVVLDQAIELAKGFGSEQSGAFVNGVLDGLIHTREFPGKLH